MATEKNEFATRLIKARSSKGWSQLDLSNASGVAAAQISRYEQGTNTPRPQIVARLANALDVKFPWLLSGAGEQVEVWSVGRNSLRVELPVRLIRLIEEAASANRRLVDEEVQARLEASFGSLQGALPAMEMKGQDFAEDVAWTPQQVKVMKEVAAEAAKQVMAFQAESLQPVHFGGGSVVQGPSPQAQSAEGKMVEPFDRERALKLYADRLDAVMSERDEQLRSWWEAEFGYDPQGPKVELPATKGPTRSPNAKRRT